MTPRQHALAMALGAAAAALSALVLGDALVRSVRFDLTDDRRFTLTAPADNAARALAEPIELTWIYAARAADAPLRAHAGFVRETLRSFEAASAGRVRVREVDPTVDAAARALAAEVGLAPLASGVGAPVAFGLVGVNAVGERAVVAQLAPQEAGAAQGAIAGLLLALEQEGAPATPPAIPIAARSLDDASPAGVAEAQQSVLVVGALIAPGLIAAFGVFYGGGWLRVRRRRPAA